MINNGREYTTSQVHYLRKTVTFADGTVSLGEVPAGAVVIGGGAVVSEVFDAGTTNTMDIGFINAGDGTTDDPNEFMSAVAVTSTGAKALDEITTAGDLVFSEGAEITATYNQSGTAPTAGSAVVYITYLADNG